MLILTVIQGPDKGKTFELPDHEPQLLGRSSEALPMTDNTVSRRHAELTPDDGHWYIRDLNSQNGTYVNGVQITRRTRLAPGDQIRTGATLFVFGRTDRDGDGPVVRLLHPGLIDANVERTIPSNEDSVILAEPEPRQAAVDHLRIIYQLTTLLAQPLDRDGLLSAVMDLVFTQFRPERGVILLSGELPEDEPRPAVVRLAQPGPPGDAAGEDARRILVSRTIIQHAIRHAEGVLSSNAMSDARFRSGDSVQRMHIRSALCAPIRHRARTYGAIYIDSTVANYTFTPEQLALLNAIGQHTALALANSELYAQKLHAERLAAVGETVASLSHSIKNILQGLRGGADVVELGLKREDLKIAHGGWAILKRNLDRIIGLTMNMLAYSRPRTLELELTDLPALLEDCAQLLHDQCAGKGVALLLDCEPDMPPLAVDAGQLHQAFMNLLTNAVEAVDPQTGAVTVRAGFSTSDPRRPDGPGPAAHVAIIDNGPGIAPEKLARIFEPFFTTKGLRGTGLGLAVARRVVEQHAGRIDVVSAPGAGATFTVILPADAGETIDPSETTGARPTGPHRPV